MIARWVLRTFVEIVFWSGIASSFMRTADLFQNFAPSQFGGYSTEGWYGIMCAVSIESLIIIAKYYYLLDPNRENSAAYEMSVKAGIAAWMLSFVAQGLDGVIVRDAMDTLSPLAKDVIYWVVPAVPLVVSGALMLFGSQLLGRAAHSSSMPKRPSEFSVRASSLGNAMYNWALRIFNPSSTTPNTGKPKVRPPDASNDEHSKKVNPPQ